MSNRIVGFNYAALESDARQTAQKNAREINTLQERTARAAVEIGRRLNEVRESIGPRNFTAWLKAEFRWTQPVSSNYMRIAERFGDLDCLARFQQSALYLLAREKTDPRAVAAAIAAARAGEAITHKRAGQLCRQFQEGHVAKAAPHSQRPGPARPATPDVLAQVRSSVREFQEHFADATLHLTPSEAAELADDFLRLAVELRTTAAATNAATKHNPDAPAFRTGRKRAAKPATVGA